MQSAIENLTQINRVWVWFVFSKRDTHKTQRDFKQITPVMIQSYIIDYVYLMRSHWLKRADRTSANTRLATLASISTIGMHIIHCRNRDTLRLRVIQQNSELQSDSVVSHQFFVVMCFIIVPALSTGWKPENDHSRFRRIDVETVL